MNSTVVLILASGSISSKLNFLRSRCPSPALIPVNTRPLAAYLIDFYAAQPGIQVRLVVNADVADAVRAELGTAEGRYQLEVLQKTVSVVDSLTQAVAALPADSDVIVNLVTTIPTQLVERDEVLIAPEPSRTHHWSGVILTQGDQKPVFSFKTAPAGPSHAFIGVFRTGLAPLQNALAAASQEKDLLAVIQALDVPLRYTPSEWIDCGHETNYYEAKAKLISSRSFNRVQVSLETGVLRKSSQHEDKLSREIDFIQMLPPAIGVYFPRVLARRAPAAEVPGFLELEFYGYPTVAEYYLYWDLSSDNWRRLFSRLAGVLRRFKAFPYSISQAAFEEFHLQKAAHRVAQFLRSLDPELRATLEGEITVNGKLLRPFSALTSELATRLAGMYRDQDSCVMHGDFCFNNILYDVPSGIVRLIDPRGSFGERCVGIYGDQKYDLAKLEHSAVHGYDFLVNGLFTLKKSGRTFDYSVATRECAPLVAQLSREVVSDLGHDPAEISLLTSLLFLSMTPLHAEDPARQLTMYAHGLRMLNEHLE